MAKESKEEIIERLWKHFESIKQALIISGVSIKYFPEKEKLDVASFTASHMRDFNQWFTKFMNKEIEAWKKIRLELPEETWNNYERMGFDATFPEVKIMKKCSRDVYHGWLDSKQNLFRKSKEKKSGKRKNRSGEVETGN